MMGSAEGGYRGYTTTAQRVGGAKAVQSYLQVRMLLNDTTLSKTGSAMIVDFGDPTLNRYLLDIRAMIDMR